MQQCPTQLMRSITNRLRNLPCSVGMGCRLGHENGVRKEPKEQQHLEQLRGNVAEHLILLPCSIAMGCLFVDREKGDGGKQINKEVRHRKGEASKTAPKLASKPFYHQCTLVVTRENGSGGSVFPGR